MKKLLSAIGVIFGVAIFAQLMGVSFAAPFPTAVGGLGTNITPASGSIPIGNGAGSYTPALLTPGSNISITNGSGTVTIAVTGTATGTVYMLSGGHGISLSPATITASGTIAVNTSTVIADVVASGNFLASSTTYVASVNGQSGVVTFGIPATTTINGTQTTVFHIIGDGITVTSTVSGATTTFSIINTGNWAGTWQGVNSSSFYLASNPNGYISSSTGNTLYYPLNSNPAGYVTSTSGGGSGAVGPSTSTYVAIFTATSTVGGYPVFTYTNSGNTSTLFLTGNNGSFSITGATHYYSFNSDASGVVPDNIGSSNIQFCTHGGGDCSTSVVNYAAGPSLNFQSSTIMNPFSNRSDYYPISLPSSSLNFIHFWFKYGSGDTNAVIFQNSDGFIALSRSPTNGGDTGCTTGQGYCVEMQEQNSSPSTHYTLGPTKNWADGNWHMLDIVFSNSTTFDLWFDGQEMSTGNTLVNPFATGMSWIDCPYSVCGANPTFVFQGDLDDMVFGSSYLGGSESALIGYLWNNGVGMPYNIHTYASNATFNLTGNESVSGNVTTTNLTVNQTSTFLGNIVGIPTSSFAFWSPTGVLTSTSTPSSAGGVATTTPFNVGSIAVVSSSGALATAFPSSTAVIYIDGDRTDSYTANGSFLFPQKTLSAAVAQSTGFQGYAYWLSPQTYVDGAPDTFPSNPFDLYGNEATIVEPSGATFPGSFDNYDTTWVGNLHESDQSLTFIHQFTNGVIAGSLQEDGLATLEGMSLPVTTDTLTISTGSLTNTVGSYIAENTVSSGTINFDDNAIQGSSSVPLVKSTAGSANFLGNTIINLGTGGALDLRNGATSTPNNINSVSIVENSSTAGSSINCGTAACVVANITGLTNLQGQFIAPSGTDWQPVYDEDRDVLNAFSVGTSTVTSGDTILNQPTFLPSLSNSIIGVNGSGQIVATTTPADIDTVYLASTTPWSTGDLTVVSSSGALAGYAATSCAAGTAFTGLSATGTPTCTSYAPSSTILSGGNYTQTINNLISPSSTLASSSVAFVFDNATTTKPYSFQDILTNTAKTISYVDCYEYAAATTTMELYYNTTNASTGIQQVILPALTCGIGGTSTTTFTTSTLPINAYLFAIVSSTLGTPQQTTLNVSALKL